MRTFPCTLILAIWWMLNKNSIMNKKNITPSASSGGDKNNNKRKNRNDLIFIGALLAVLLAVGVLIFAFRKEGDRVVVTVNGEEFGNYPLSEDTVVDIRTGENGQQLNRLVVKDSKAFVDTATCPDGICSDHKPISHDGESIVCLPHKVVVTVEQNNK